MEYIQRNKNTTQLPLYNSSKRNLESPMDKNKYNQFVKLSFKITKGDERHLDLLHDVLIQLSENKKWINLTDKEQLYFLTKTISNQFYSNNSQFNRTYRRFKSEDCLIPEVPEEPYKEKPTLEWINEFLTETLQNSPQMWYEIGLFRLWIKSRKIEIIHKQTQIPRYSIRETINQMKKFINEQWKIYQNASN